MLNEGVFIVNNLNPVALQIGSFQIYWYSLAYLLGAIYVYIFTGKYMHLSPYFNFKENKKDKKEFLESLLFSGMLGVVLGGRLGYIFIYNLDYYLQNPMHIFYIWQGGMSFHGGVLGASLGFLATAKKNKVSFLATTDLVVCFVPFGILLGRVANFANQELYGAVTHLPWAVIFPNVDNLPRHPSQLYEAFFEGFVLLIIMFLLLTKTKLVATKGVLSGIMLMCYSVFRFAIEFVRLPDIQVGYLFANFTLGHVLSLLLFAFGAFVVMQSFKNAK